ncbi:BtrH N-terminal domain-containing protein [Rhodococcus sp. H36-A4]|uniref:BtrH N-terminal domain-containing protein n=1 Tax=Rhodococcus sp. H36-A4 TaxID=3004353 RepID=UPI0022AEF989|nr:BtrH N-terminal domain-containing protein [Rhodococcus sp. H36-A4]MCZ4077207.1 BtrH N-terminal domain-containing protein [Rhodococcus sp. H36-A4]
MPRGGSDGPVNATIIDAVPTAGGLHCETTALGVLLTHAGLSLSEPMLFGLGAALSFVYWDSKQQDLPFLGGRVKPFALTQALTSRLGVALRVEETTSARKAWDRLRTTIDRGTPVGLQLDSYELEYFGSRVHFAGHVVAMYGYDQDTAYLIDTAQQGGKVSTTLESLTRARAARGPMSAHHRAFTVNVPTAAARPERIHEAIVPAITACATEFLAPPIANLGNRGILTAAKRIPSWFDRVADPARDLAVIAMLMERAGTGGALFRNLYRDFLTESEELVARRSHADIIVENAARFAESALLWTRASELIAHAGSTGQADFLTEAAEVLRKIEWIETAAMTSLASLEKAEQRGGRQ